MKVSFDPVTGMLTSTSSNFAEISEGKLSGDLIPDSFDDVQRFETLAAFPQLWQALATQGWSQETMFFASRGLTLDRQGGPQ